MVSCVHYKFWCTTEFKKILFKGPIISYEDLKEEIIKANRLGRFEEFELKLTNEQSGEDYEPGSFIDRNTVVLAARLPALKSRKRKRANKNVKTSSNMYESEMDDVVNYTAPPPGYVCYKCGMAGHWIKDCFKEDDEDQPFRRLKRATGIPKSMLEIVNDPNIPGVMISQTGQLVVLKNQKEENLQNKNEVVENEVHEYNSNAYYEIEQELKLQAKEERRKRRHQEKLMKCLYSNFESSESSTPSSSTPELSIPSSTKPELITEEREPSSKLDAKQDIHVSELPSNKLLASPELKIYSEDNGCKTSIAVTAVTALSPSNLSTASKEFSTAPCIATSTTIKATPSINNINLAFGRIVPQANFSPDIVNNRAQSIQSIMPNRPTNALTNTGFAQRFALPDFSKPPPSLLPVNNTNMNVFNKATPQFHAANNINMNLFNQPTPQFPAANNINMNLFNQPAPLFNANKFNMVPTPEGQFGQNRFKAPLPYEMSVTRQTNTYHNENHRDDRTSEVYQNHNGYTTGSHDNFRGSGKSSDQKKNSVINNQHDNKSSDQNRKSSDYHNHSRNSKRSECEVDDKRTITRNDSQNRYRSKSPVNIRKSYNGHHETKRSQANDHHLAKLPDAKRPRYDHHHHSHSRREGSEMRHNYSSNYNYGRSSRSRNDRHRK